MAPLLYRAGNGISFLGVALLGGGLSLALYPAWELDSRWIAVVFLAIAGVAVAMCLARIFSDFLLVVTLFSLPFAAFSKWFWPSDLDPAQHGDIVMVGVFGVGLIDFLLAGLYLSWFYRVFVTREQPLPRLNALDGFILWYVLAYVVSMIGCQDPEIGFGSTEYLIKHVLLYFYLSRHLEERHLPWLLAAFAFTITLEALLGAYQFTTGQVLGLALDKGAGSVDILNFQDIVPGTEGYHRATGTTIDAHVLGHFTAMMLPFALVLFFTPRLRPLLKSACLAAAAGGVVIILLSLSRTAWLASAISLSIGIMLIVVLWRERQVVPALAAVVVLVALAAPFSADYIYERFARSPIETLTIRFEQYALAWHIFTLFPLFGIGPGNWMAVWQRYDFTWLYGDPSYNLVHNVVLWNAVEVGIFGLIAYLGILASAMLRLFGLARRRRDIAGRLGLAVLIGLFATELHGLTDGAFRDPNAYMMFWVLVSLSVALPRLRPDAGAFLMTPPQPASGPAAAPGMVTGGADG